MLQLACFKSYFLFVVVKLTRDIISYKKVNLGERNGACILGRWPEVEISPNNRWNKTFIYFHGC